MEFMARASRSTVLLVDDNERDRELLRTELETLPICVVEANAESPVR
jgi:CheY-like chemotaxis protein